MAKTRRKPEPEIEITERDYVMARLLAARSAAQDALNAIDEAAELFTNPDEDKKGKHRVELVDTALEASGAASRALESAQEVLDDVDMQEGEPWDDESEDDDSEDEDTEEDDEDGDETDPEDD